MPRSGCCTRCGNPFPRFKDYIALQTQYVSVAPYIVVGPDGARVELQIRTRRCTGLPKRALRRTGAIKSRPRRRTGRTFCLAATLEWQQDVQDPIEFMETVKIDMFQEEVYVFTPRGEVRTPRGATPVDFAYTVHTDIGHQCVGAKVNGRIVPLRYQLRNGDTVEISRHLRMCRVVTGYAGGHAAPRPKLKPG